MKRFAFAVGVLSMFASTTFACTTTGVSAAGPVAPVGASTDLVDEAAANVIPSGTFASLESLCAAQRKLVEPRIEEAKKSFASEGSGDLDIAPSCEVDEAALKDAKILLGAGLREVKAVEVESGYATELYLTVHTRAGWSAVRTPILHAEHNDPGCGAIERPTSIAAVRIENGLLVVQNEATRTWSNDKEAGELTLTYARTCTAGASCGAAAIVAAKVEAEEVDSDGPLHMRIFSTTYSVAKNGVILPATTFDESTL